MPKPHSALSGAQVNSDPVLGNAHALAEAVAETALMRNNYAKSVPTRTGDLMTLGSSLRFHATCVTAFVIILMAVVLVYATVNHGFIPPLLLIVLLGGALGGGLNNYFRLRSLPTAYDAQQPIPAQTLAIFQIYLSPVVAAALSGVLYGLFVSGLVAGDIFPKFEGVGEPYKNVAELFITVMPASNGDAIKALMWSVVAGFSELMVPNILNRLAGELRKSSLNQDQHEKPVLHANQSTSDNDSPAVVSPPVSLERKQS